MTYTFVLGAISGTYNIIASVANLVPDHTITQGDVTLLKNGKAQMFIWRDEDESIHTSGDATSIVHNLGYLESTDDPPLNNLNTDRGKVSVGIHLKYKSGDLFLLADQRRAVRQLSRQGHRNPGPGRRHRMALRDRVD